MNDFDKLLAELMGEDGGEKKKKKTGGKKITHEIEYPEDEEYSAVVVGKKPEYGEPGYKDFAGAGIAAVVAGCKRMAEATGVDPIVFAEKVVGYAVKQIVVMGLEMVFND